MARMRWIIASLMMMLGATASGAAEPSRRSQCLAVAKMLPHVIYASVQTTATTDEVTIRYAGHATYVIETPDGVRIATDYTGTYDTGGLPDVVTMNRAHATHYTLHPDPRIPHVLHGWGENGEPAKHYLTVRDVLIRNVPTDIRRSLYGYGPDTEMIRDGNSIFIFEVAGLCIGHLGHLHHPLDDSHFAAIGRLDIVMVPIDGTYTMSLDGMSQIVRRLRSSVVLPMHRFGTPLTELLSRLSGQFAIDRRNEPFFRISASTLPKTPMVIVLSGV